jgi:hypothetical protein
VSYDQSKLQRREKAVKYGIIMIKMTKRYDKIRLDKITSCIYEVFLGHCSARPRKSSNFMSEIIREKRPDSAAVPPLDPSLLSLSDVEKEFLRSEISADEVELYQKLFELQKEYVIPLLKHSVQV